VSNAIYVSPEGGTVRLTVEEVQRDGQARCLAFSVEDEGPGLDDAMKSRIFEPFFTTKPPGEGTGLGLSVARDIVSEHGGSIEVTSAPGQGSRFTVLLPRSEGDVEPHPGR
jgi:signal transduction histidine kinase